MIMLQRDDSQFLKKDIPKLLNLQKAFKNMYISKGQRRVYKYKFSKVNALIKGIAEDTSQEEVWKV